MQNKEKTSHPAQFEERKTLWPKLDSDSHLIQVNFKPNFPPQQYSLLFGSELWLGRWHGALAKASQAALLLPPSIVDCSISISIAWLLSWTYKLVKTLGRPKLSRSSNPLKPLCWALSHSSSHWKNIIYSMVIMFTDDPLLAVIAISQPCLHFCLLQGLPSELRLISNVIDMKPIESH